VQRREGEAANKHVVAAEKLKVVFLSLLCACCCRTDQVPRILIDCMTYGMHYLCCGIVSTELNCCVS
jgi:hypothetical protein